LSRREAALSALLVFVVAVAVRAWAASLIAFPRPEDAAYYVAVARNLVSTGHLTSDAIWSYTTPPLSFPRPAFEVWLPLPALAMAVPMYLFGTGLASAQAATILAGSIVAVLAWRLALNVAIERSLSLARTRAIALGSGLTVAVYLPLVLASVEPDSTAVFAALVLAACLLMTTLGRKRSRLAMDLLGLGALIGLAALTRNEAVWLGATWAIVAWGAAGRAAAPARRVAVWIALVGVPGLVALAVFAPWAVRDWIAFGTPVPGQAIGNALSLNGNDIFAWSDPPTLSRYLAAGPATLIGLRVTGFLHNVLDVLLLLGVPVSAIGLVAMPWTVLGWSPRGRAGAPATALRPLLIFSVITFLATTLLFPVATVWGTFLHAAGAVEVLLVTSAVLALDRVIEIVGERRKWTNPVAWLGPTLTITAAALLTVVVLPSEGAGSKATATLYSALPSALRHAGVSLDTLKGPVITDHPIWFAAATGHQAIVLPDEDPQSVLDLAKHFGATLLIVGTDNGGRWPEVATTPVPKSNCFTPLVLTHLGDDPDPLADVTVYRIRCP
jgi:hypothetical protein